MSTRTLPVMFSQSGQTLEVSTQTPLIAELDAQFKQGHELKSAIERLMRASGLLKGEVEDALRTRILAIPEVRAALERLLDSGLVVEDAGEQHVTLTRLSAATKPFVLKLEASGGKEITPGQAVISVKGEAELALTARAYSPAEAAKLNLPIAASDVLHSCQLGGNLGLKANIAPATVGAGVGASIDIDAEARLGVSWHFQRHGEDTVLNSLVYSALDVGQGARPWDLDDVMRVLDEPREANAHLDALKAIDVLAERSLAFSAGLEIKRGFSKSWLAQGATGPQAIHGAASLGAGLRFGVHRKGRYAVRLRKQGGDVILDLDAMQQSSRTSGFDLGLGIGISGLDALATGWINTLLPELPEDFKPLLEKWSTPGSLLKAKFDKALRDNFGRALLPLVPVLTGDASADEVAEQQVERLFARWEEALNSRVALIGTSSAAIFDSLLDDAREVLGEHYALVESSLKAQAERVQAQIEALQADLQADVDRLVATLKNKSEAALLTALRPLERIGERVDQLAKSLDNSAAPLAAAIKRLLGRYEHLRKALLDGAKQAAKLKLGLAFKATVENTRGEERALSLRFSRASDSAKRWFSDLMLGRVAIDIDELQQAARLSQGAFAVESGSFVAFASRARSASLTLDVFGMPFGDQRLLASDVRVEVDAAGRIRVLSLSATQSDESWTRKEARAARFSADFDALEGLQDPQLGVFSLGFELSDDRLKPKELTQFFSSFVDAGVLPSAVTQRAQALLGEGTSRNVQLSVSMSRLAQALRAAAGESRESLQREAWQNCIRFMRPRADIARLIKLDPERAYRKVTAIRRGTDALRLAEEFLVEVGGSISGNERKRLAVELRILHRAINAIPDALAALAEIKRIADRLRGGQVSDNDARTARDELDRILEQANQALSPVVDVNDGVFGLFSERLPDLAVALLAMLNRLAGNDGLGAAPVLRAFAFDASGNRQFEAPVLIG
jgi:hypothetical protein